MKNISSDMSGRLSCENAQADLILTNICNIRYYHHAYLFSPSVMISSSRRKNRLFATADH